MEDQFLKFFDSNKDAVFTNRGFYYQYLVVLKKWITNFINESDVITFTEVDNDVKEVGEVLYFTQIKCYSSTFSFASSELQKAVFDFFILELKYKSLFGEQKFCFYTNTSVAKKEKLLLSWIAEPTLSDAKLKDMAVKKVREIIKDEFNIRKNKKISSAKNEQTKLEIKVLADKFKTLINSDSLTFFVEKLQWEFKNERPELAIESLQYEIMTLLGNKKFLGRPVSLLLNAFLSEIYKRSQNKKKEDRSLTKITIETILFKTDSEIESLVNHKFTALLGVELEFLKKEILNLQALYLENKDEIIHIKEIINNPLIIPKELTFIPEMGTQPFIGREELLFEINSILKDKNSLSIYGVGGIGKTALAKEYIKTTVEKDHLIWITVEDSIKDAFIFNDVLIYNLQLAFTNDDTPEKRFDIIINAINKISGNNLIVIDIQSQDDKISVLNSIKWQKIIVTRHHLKSLPCVNVSSISFEDAKLIYSHYRETNVEDDTILKVFFEYIQYNILVIELTAKTIAASFDLTLDLFFKKLVSQNLNGPELEIDIIKNQDQTSVRIFSFLQGTFETDRLKPFEKTYLEFLALLPSTNIVIRELIELCGLEFFDTNKVHITNTLNGLETKGWIEISSDKRRVNVHRIIQEMIIYKERDSNNPFTASMFYIPWLSARLKEGTNNPSQAFNFLKYAQSILSSIKEQYRITVYQPMLLLENELLYSYNFYFRPKNQIEKWIDLEIRARKNLNSANINLAVISNNLALAYRDNNQIENAAMQFKKSIDILKENLPISGEILIVTMNNLSQLEIDMGNLPAAMNIFSEVQKIRKKYNFWNDQQLSVQYFILSKAYYLCRDLKQAVMFLKDAINFHKQLALSQRNDFILASYYNQLSLYNLDSKDIRSAIVNMKIAVNILESMQLGESIHTIEIYKMLLHLYKFSNNEKKTEYIKARLAVLTNDVLIPTL
jgi:hypothetical protein